MIAATTMHQFAFARPSIKDEIQLIGKGVIFPGRQEVMSSSPGAIGFKIINSDCAIGRRDITIQLPPSSLAKLIILKLIDTLICVNPITLSLQKQHSTTSEVLRLLQR
jgi:hypothetical protein